MRLTGDAAEFTAGIDDGFDPQPAGDDERAGELVTHAFSWWNTATCTGCGHTFRRGDRVRVDPVRRVVGHLDAALGCLISPVATDRPGGDGGTGPVRDFVAGVLAEFPLPPDLLATLTDDVRGLLAPPDRGFGRNACLVCGHTFRSGEFVIVCPCRPAGRRCRAAVHRDPIRGLVCRENWRAGTDVRTCPITLQKVLA
jgi:hypothetical protein